MVRKSDSTLKTWRKGEGEGAGGYMGSSSAQSLPLPPLLLERALHTWLGSTHGGSWLVQAPARAKLVSSYGPVQAPASTGWPGLAGR